MVIGDISVARRILMGTAACCLALMRPQSLKNRGVGWPNSHFRQLVKNYPLGPLTPWILGP